MKQNSIIKIVGILTYMGFILFSFMAGFDPGKQIGKNFITFSVNMLKVLPCTFVLIGLFYLVHKLF